MRKPKKSELQKLEGNLARVGLISIQDRIPESYLGWSEEFAIGSQVGTVTCEAIASHGGVPHGLDNDIMTAILDLYIQSGANREGVLITTPHQILSQAGLDTSGRYYQLLHKSLKRLRFAAYTVTGLWYDAPQQRYTTTTFTHFSEFSFSSSNKGELNRSTELMLRLSEHIVNSIQAKFLRQIDLNLLRALTRPLSRSLYRLLESRRMDPVLMEGKEPLQCFETTLQQWASACKIVDRRSDKIRRTLEPAHLELLELQYLSDVRFTGRGAQQSISYDFRPSDRGGQESHEQVASPGSQTQAPVVKRQTSNPKNSQRAVLKPSERSAALMTQMISYGVSKVMAARLLEEFGEAHIIERLERAERGLKGGYRPKNRSGFIVDIIRSDSEKYISPLFEDQQQKQLKAKEGLQKLEAEQEQQLEDELSHVRAMRRSEQVTWFFSRIRFMLTSVMNEVEINLLEKQLEQGNEDIVELPKMLVKMYTSGERNQIRKYFHLD
jgi:plasmid replication initiation protein